MGAATAVRRHGHAVGRSGALRCIGWTKGRLAHGGDVIGVGSTEQVKMARK